MDRSEMRDFLKYGVELFKYHADQRLRCIRYYIIILAACIAGILQFSNRERLPSLSLIIFLVCASSGVTLFFWLLDIRNRVLTGYAEEGLKKAENDLFVRQSDCSAQDLCIVNNCEDKEKEQAWHYGDIVPHCFLSIMALAVFIAFGMIVFRCFYANWHGYVISKIFLVVSFVFFLVGCYAEGRFLVKGRKEVKGSEIVSRRLICFFEKYNCFWSCITWKKGILFLVPLALFILLKGILSLVPLVLFIILFWRCKRS